VIIGAEGLLALIVPMIVGPWSDRLRTPLGGRLPFLLAGIPGMAVALVRWRRPIHRSTRRGWTSCRRGCGVGPRACARCCRQTAQAAAPVLFGLLSDAAELQATLLILLVALALNGALLLAARRDYPADVATAGAAAYPRGTSTASRRISC
jgi:hypothetical protein